MQDIPQSIKDQGIEKITDYVLNIVMAKIPEPFRDVAKEMIENIIKHWV